MTRVTDIERRASEWIIRSEADHFTVGMQAQMERWLRADPYNRATYVRLREAWRRAGRVRGTRPLDGRIDADLLREAGLSLPANDTAAITKRRGPQRSMWVAASAALMLITYLIWLFAWTAFGSSRWIPYTTSIGGYESVTLPDGSAIQLNTDTELRARVTPSQREIELVRGEALVKVAGDTRRPFVVRTAGAAVRVDRPGERAATFVIRLHTTAGVDVAVTSGSVVFGPSARLLDLALGRRSEPQSRLEAGEVARIRPAGVHLTKVGLEELNRKLSWTAGLLSFQGETLAEVTDEFNRYNRKHLVVVDPGIAARRIGGAFQATDPDSFVSALRKGFDVRTDEQHLAESDSTVIRLGGAALPRS